MISTTGDELLMSGARYLNPRGPGPSRPTNAGRPARHAYEFVVALVLAASVAGCRSSTRAGGPGPGPASAAAVRGHLGGRLVELGMADGKITTITTLAPGAGGADAEAWLVPAIVDSHVHLSFWPVADRLRAHGVAAAIDLGAPMEALGADAPLTILGAGPLLTRPDGYPLSSWGAGGYGVGCVAPDCVQRTVSQLAVAGARLVKVTLGDDGLPPALLPVAVGAAHERGLMVAVHALTDADAATAAAAGCDVLAHTPVEPLAEATVAAWAGRTVISTLAAFGGSDAAVDNLRRLRAAGATVLYGTDLGNLRDDGPSRSEIALLGAAGLDGAAIVEAMTTTPARVWRLPVGALAVGQPASLLVVDADPTIDPSTLTRPRAVWMDGALQ